MAHMAEGREEGSLDERSDTPEDLYPRKLNVSGTITLLAISSNINNLFALVIGLGRGEKDCKKDFFFFYRQEEEIGLVSESGS